MSWVARQVDTSKQQQKSASHSCLTQLLSGTEQKTLTSAFSSQTDWTRIAQRITSIIWGNEGHWDNPHAVQLWAVYKAAAVDSMFVVFTRNSKWTEDADSFPLKLKGATQDSQAPTPASVSLPPHMTDLLSIAYTPNFCVEEGHIIVYIVGYLTRKPVKKYSSTDCRQQLLRHVVGTGEEFTFFNRKQ